MLSRIYLRGEIYFVTTKTFHNKKIFDKNLVCELFIKVLADCRLKYKFRLYGYIIIPNHVHLLIMPDDRMNISEVMHRIKGNFAYQYIIGRKNESRNHKGSATWWDNGFKINSNHIIDPSNRVADPLRVGEPKNQQKANINPVWQKSFYDHIIRNDLDFEEKLGYIHGNPIKHNIIDNLDDYPWSSYQNYYLENNNLIEIDYLEL